MATYEEIKSKYADRTREHRAGVTLAASKVERLQAQIDFYTEEREQYRQRDGVISAHNVQRWNAYTDKLRTLDAQLNEAKNALMTAQIGKGGTAALAAEIDKMNL